MTRPGTVAATFALCGVAALLLLSGVRQAGSLSPPRPAWTEVKWPFPMDQWGEGSAFHCKAADCGHELTIYLRAKFGFCSSTTGVNNDEELERVSNFDFMDDRFAPRGAGRPIDVAWMKGRIRAYSSQAVLSWRRPSAIIAAFNNESDVMVATLLLSDTAPAAVEPYIVDFLNGAVAQGWIKARLGL